MNNYNEILKICNCFPYVNLFLSFPVGYPHPYFRWRKIGNNYFKESTKKLVIANATLSDSGSYTCNAQNIEGEGGTDILEVRVKG